jgi:PST family polysaccharide transporter
VTIEALASADPPEGSAVADGLTQDAKGRDRDLDHSLMRGILWTSGVKWGGQAATWISTLVVARVLGPEAYGLVGMAAIYMGLVTMLSEFGIGSAVVTMRSLSPGQIAQVNTVAVGIGFLAMLTSLTVAIPVGLAFGVPQVTSIILALSPTLLLGGLQTVPSALLQREMRFKLLAVTEGVQTLLVAIVTIVCAFRGAGFWSLVIGQAVGTMALTAMLVLASPFRFAYPRRRDLHTAITFSSHMIIARMAWYVYSNADFAVVGKMLGKTALGAYSFGWTLANVPIEKVTSMFIRVTPSVLAAVREDPPALRRYLLRITEVIAVMTFPAAVGIALVANSFVLATLGEHWRGAILPLRLLAIYSGVRSISPLIPPVLAALGETRFAMRWNVIGAIIFPIGFVIASYWGVAGVAAAWIVIHPLVLLPMYRFVFRALELPVRDYLSALWPATSGVIVMGLAVALTHHFLLQSSTPLVRLLEMSIVGAIAYTLTLLVGHGGRIRALRSMMAELRAG